MPEVPLRMDSSCEKDNAEAMPEVQETSYRPSKEKEITYEYEEYDEGCRYENV